MRFRQALLVETTAITMIWSWELASRNERS
jgi:hypothetical protein